MFQVRRIEAVKSRWSNVALFGVVELVLLLHFAEGQVAPDKILCPEGPRGASCRSFKDAVDDEDRHVADAAKKDHVIVCFRSNEDVFLLLSYDSPKRTLWHKAQDQSSFEQPGAVEFTRFRNGNANLGGESLRAVGHWLASSPEDQQFSHFSGTSLVPGGSDPSIVLIDGNGILISHHFQDRFPGPVIHYNFSMKSPATNFVETFTEPAASGHGEDHLAENSGNCIRYK